MPFHPKLQDALNTYKKDKGIRYYTHKNPVIVALEALPESERTNPLEIFKCFINDNFKLYIPALIGIKVPASFAVFQAFIDSLCTVPCRFELSSNHIYLASSAPQHLSSHKSITIHWDKRWGNIKYSLRRYFKETIITGTLTKQDLKDNYASIAEVAKSYRLSDETSGNSPYYRNYTRSLTNPEKEAIFMALAKKGYASRDDQWHYSSHFLERLRELYINNLLTNANFQRILNFLCNYSSQTAVAHLFRQDLLTNDNLNRLFLLNETKLRALYTLSASRTFNQNNFEILCSSSEEFAGVIWGLSSQYQTFTQRLFNGLASAVSPSQYVLAWRILQNTQISTQANLDLLSNPVNHYLVSDEANTYLWSRLPSHLLTQNVFNQLIIFAQTETPGDAIRTYVHQLLVHRPVARANETSAEIGDSQSTHKVHDSVAASLRRLEKRYSLTAQEINMQLTKFQHFRNEIRAGNFNHLNDVTLGENKCATAIVSINRLVTMANNDNVRDDQTQFSLKKIIALVWKGVTDETVQDETIGLSAKERLINELSNVQLAYGIDASGRSLPSCDGGTMNGLVNILDGIHPDVTLVLINNDTVFAFMLKHARQIFMDNFEQQSTDQTFIEQLRQEASSADPHKWNSIMLAQWYENCLKQTITPTEQDIDLTLQQAKLSAEQIRSLNQRVKNEWIPQSMRGLRLYKYMLHDTLEKYDAKVNAAEVVAKEPEKDDFDQLIHIFESAILAQRQSQNNASITHSNIFSKVNFEKIAEFIDILKTKSSEQATEWLQIKENYTELEKGILFRSLKHQLNNKKPFGCSSLRELENCFKNNQNVSLNPLKN